MAGDWIKMEHVTPDKPEIVSIALALGIDQDSVVGKLARVWIWADQQSLDGHDIRVTEAFIDRIACHSGFAQAMRKVRWLEGENGALSIPHFERHNGETAKARALASKRQRSKRSREQRDISVTREEKRREEKNRTPKPPKRGRSGSVFSRVTDEHLKSDTLLLRWAIESFDGIQGDELRLIFSAAEHSKTGEVPIRLFVATVRDKAWDKISSAEKQRGWERLKAASSSERNGDPGPEAIGETARRLIAKRGGHNA